jgi:hypothetical protein
MTERDHPDGVPELVEAMLEGYAPVSVLLEHMFESPSRPTVAEVRSVLGELLCDTLEPLAATFAADDLKTSAAVIEATIPLIVENLYFVTHAPQRRAGARRRPHGGRTSSRRR